MKTSEPGQPGVTSQGKGRLPTIRGNDRRLRESIAEKDEAAILSREKMAEAREDAAHLREDAADMRETIVILREGKIRQAEIKQKASEYDRNILQKVNERLVIATIEANKLAEQVETARVDLDHLAHHDILTDLPNRILLQDRLGQAVEIARRQGRKFAVMFMDLDHFKHINDSLGHTVGDQLLQSVAQRLVGSVRQSDTICRQGGDEFLLLLPYIEHAEDAALSAQKMLAATALSHHIEGYDLHISVSIGISIYPDDGLDAETLIRRADTAMYYAKESGRNNYKFFELDMNVLAVQRKSIETDLRLALERQEFVLYYQPKINLHSGLIVGVEALIRWQHPELGLLPPAQFVHIAEDCGLILPIGRWVLRKACLQAQAWRQAGLPPLTIAVNTSAIEFRAKDFLENLCATLEDTRLDTRYLELELTESILMQDAESTDSVLHALSDLGVKLAIDDFGTGYSSLSYLRQFPIDTLKIDQSFVNQMTSNPDDATIASTVISMGKSLKLHVIAEGVETPEQYAFLLAQHCDEGQGYYFSPPLAAEALATLLQTGISPA
jgi:diguanylate cyclase (GGDEF)-like protein